MRSSPVPGPSTHQTSEKPRPFAGHDGRIHAIRYSPDGKQIATGGSDPAIRIWNSDTGEVLFEPKGHASYVDSVCYSPDGKRLASGDVRGTVRVWDTSNGEHVLERVKAHETVTTVTYSPDNRHLATGGGKTVRIWSEDLRKTIEIEHPDWVESVDFSPDGRRLVTGCNDSKVRIFDVKTGTIVVGPLEGHTRMITAVAYSPDGEQLAGCSFDQTIRTWDTSTGSALLGPLEGHVDAVNCVVYSPDGRHLVSGSRDRCIRLWDSQSGKLIGRPIRGHDGRVMGVSFALHGTRFVTGGDDGQMRVWDAHTLDILAPELTEDETELYGLTGPFRGHLGQIQAVAYSRDGERIASVSADDTIRIWDAWTGKLVAVLLGNLGHRVWSIAISSHGSRLVSGGDNIIIVWDGGGDIVWHTQIGVGRVWDARTGTTVLGSLTAHSHSVTSVSYSPDGRRICSGSGDGTICMWHAQTGDLLLDRLKVHHGPVVSAEFSPDGKKIVTGWSDGTIRFWDTATGEMIHFPVTDDDMPVTDVLAQASETQPIRQIDSVLDLPATTRLQDFWGTTAPAIHDDRVVRLAFFSFTRLRHAIMSMFRNSQPAPDAVEFGERRHRRAPRPVRTAYAPVKHFVFVASRTPPRPQAFLDLSDEPGAMDSGGSAEQMRDSENGSSPQLISIANTSGSQPGDTAPGEGTQQVNQHGSLSMQHPAPYTAFGPAGEAPHITSTGSIESDDSYEIDCCWCCPRWCVCCHR